MERRFTFAVVLIAALCQSGRARAQCRDWQPGFYLNGLDSDLSCLRVFDDGRGPGLYAGGKFTRAGENPVRGIARWNGSSWIPLGQGVTAPPNVWPYYAEVTALETFDLGNGEQLYAAGMFTTAGGAPAKNLARWDGSRWFPVATAMTTTAPSGVTQVEALAVFDDGRGPALYAGGYFESIDGVSTMNIARWDGAGWEALGAGTSPGVSALAVFDDGTGPALYAGGAFQQAGGSPAMFIAKWNGTAWSEVGGGTFGGIFALHVFDDGSGPALYAGGSFSAAGGTPALGIAKWDGNAWSALGGGVGPHGSGEVHSFTTYDDGSGPALYVGGLFTTSVGGPGENIAKWTASGWSQLAGGIDQRVTAIASFDEDGAGGASPALFAGGWFDNANGKEARRIARWRDGTWSRVGGGLGFSPIQGNTLPHVADFVVHDDGKGPALYAGGAFEVAGGVAAANIARWTGTGWSPVGSEVWNDVRSLAVFDDGSGPALYAGGGIAHASSSYVHNVVRWNGTRWSEVGTGTDAPVDVLGVYDAGFGPSLYAGGTFTIAGGKEARTIARWDGSSWSPLGSGLVLGCGSKCGPIATSMAVFDAGTGPGLYVGGRFDYAGGLLANNIARWDGNAWSVLGTGLDGGAGDLAVFDDGSGPALIVGGGFTHAGAVAANHLAKWNGSSWSAFGGGADGGVGRLEVFDDGSGPALYASGDFDHIGGVAAHFIAKWKDGTWTPLSGGIGNGTGSDGVWAMKGFDDGSGSALFVGGSFSQAGAFDSRAIAVWRSCEGGPASTVCAGDGSSIACPCGNAGGAGRGCQNSVATGGSILYASGTTASDTIVLHAWGELPSALTVFLQGNVLQTPPRLFGDGIRCAGGQLKRLYSKSASGGAVAAPMPGDPSIRARSAMLGDAIPSGSARFYQAYYRDPNASFCPAPVGNTFNASNGVRIVW